MIIVIKVVALALIIFSAVNKLNAASSLSKDSYIVAGCSIFDKNGSLIRKFFGNECIFMSDGRVIKITSGSVEVLNAQMERQWVQNTFAHHQLNLTKKLDKILILSYAAHNFLGCKTRFDVLKILDIKTGQIIHEFDFWQERKMLIEMSRSDHLLRKTVGDRFLNSEFECEFTHTNSFQEIPVNKTFQWNSAWKAGNYMVGAMYLGEFLIFNSELKKILWTKGYSEKHHGYHDVQVLENGHVLFYQNFGYGKNNAVVSSLEEINPITGKKILHRNLFIDGELNYTPTQGGVVKLNNGHYIFNAVTDKYGAEIFETDIGGNIVFRFTPFPDPHDGTGLHFQQPRVYKLNDFLKNNQGGG